MSSVLRETRSAHKFQNHLAGKAYVFEKLLFLDGSAWTEGLTVEIKLSFSNFSIRISVNGAPAVPTTRSLNLDFPQLFPSSRVAKAELTTRKICETSRKLSQCCHDETHDVTLF